MRLLRGVHASPGLEGLWPEEIVHRVHDGLQTNICFVNTLWNAFEVTARTTRLK